MVFGSYCRVLTYAALLRVRPPPLTSFKTVDRCVLVVLTVSAAPGTTSTVEKVGLVSQAVGILEPDRTRPLPKRRMGHSIAKVTLPEQGATCHSRGRTRNPIWCIVASFVFGANRDGDIWIIYVYIIGQTGCHIHIRCTLLVYYMQFGKEGRR